MRMKSTAFVTAAGAVAAVAFLAGCGASGPPGPGQPTTGASTASPAPSVPATRAVKDLTPGNCTVYPKADAVKLLGGVNLNNKNLEIGTDGGTKIDTCSYIDVIGLQSLRGVSYAVVRYDSAATAFAEAQKVQTEMLGSAAGNNWPVQSLTTPAPGAGKVLGGYGTKTEDGVTYTIAVVGTNVGPYLVAALGASTEGTDRAKAYALSVFQALSAATG
jgi:hypothetical protein